MSRAVLRTLCGALVCLALTAYSCPGGEAAPTPTRVVPYGGQFAPERALVVAEAAAWLAGLERAADALAGLEAARLAGLDALQLQALAAGMGMVEVKGEVRVGGDVPEGEGEATAVARLAAVDAGLASRLLADENGRERYEDIIVALGRLIPEAVRLAHTGRALRVLRLLPDAPASETPADEPVITRLNRLADEVEAYSLYRDWLEQVRRASGDFDFPGQTEEAAEADDVGLKRADKTGTARPDKAVVDKALSLAPEALPLRLARAELLLREDRFRAAAQVLENLPSAPDSADTARDRADRRLLASALETRALAQLRSGRPAIAESDLTSALALAPKRGSLWLVRVAARQMRESFEFMCDDYHQACVRGLCRGLAEARERGQCLGDGKER